MNRMRIFLGAALAVPMVSATAHAHHVMDGTLPQSFLGGLLSGFGHPVIGLDHFASVIAVGLVAALYRSAYWMPTYFLAAMVAGVGIHLAAVDLPIAEIAIAVSVIVLGGLAIRAKAVRPALAAALFALAGLFHGYAYGESIVGAQASPLIAYFVGLVVIQYGIAAGVVRLLRNNGSQARPASRTAPARITAGAVLGIGLVFLVNNIAA